MNTAELLQAHVEPLTDLVAASIAHGWHHRAPLPVTPKDYPALQGHGACFVTLKREGKLRGCIGTLRAWRPLAEDVAHNAHAAAFSDPRFSALRRADIRGLTGTLSVLTPRTPMALSDRASLLADLRPSVDGLLIQDGRHRATFLPSVWAQLPDPGDFLDHLLHKAGLSVGHWSPELRAWRYTSELLPLEGLAERLRHRSIRGSR